MVLFKQGLVLCFCSHPACLSGVFQNTSSWWLRSCVLIPWLDTMPSNYFRGTKEQSIYLSMTHICSAEAWCECVFSCQVHAQASYRFVNHAHTWGCGRLSSMESGGGSRWWAPGQIPSRGLLLPAAFKQTVSAQSCRFCDANIHHCQQPASRNYRYIVLKILSR